MARSPPFTLADQFPRLSDGLRTQRVDDDFMHGKTSDGHREIKAEKNGELHIYTHARTHR